MQIHVRRSVLVAAAVAGCALSAGAAVGAGSSAAAPVSSGGAAPVGARQQVTLVTGDIVSVSTGSDGRQTASVLRANPSGVGGQFQMFTLGADLYVVPQSAVPYLGNTMDLALFDVTTLARTGSASTAVRVTYRSAASPSAVPGISIAQRSGTTAQGLVTPASGRAFGAALATQWTRDHATATHTTGLFAAVAHLGTTSAPAVQPDYPMHTLTVNGVDETGAKDTGDDFLLYNVDDLRKYAGQAYWSQGLAKVSVPAGHYAALSFFYDPVAAIVRVVITPQFAVNADTAITLDARAATAPVSVTTPKKATAATTEVGLGRTDQTGATATYSFIAGGTTSFLVQPVSKRVSIGQLHYYVYSRLFSPDDGSTPYTYDLEFPSDGVIAADQHYAVHTAGLAAIDSSYPAGHADQAAIDTRFAALPWQSALLGANQTFTTPTRRTEYYTARPELNWQGVYYSVFDPDTFAFLGSYESGWRTYSPGTSFATTWGGALEHPRLLEGDLYVGETVCPACISGTRLDVLGYPFGDNSSEHIGFPDWATAPGLTESVSYGIYADDVPVKTGSSTLDAEVTLPDGSQNYRIDYDTVRSSKDFTLSTDVRTRWTVPAGAPTDALPAGWVCTYRADPPADCGVLPLVTSSYQLPVDLLGRLSSGATTGTLRLGHLGGSTGIALKTVKATVSFDGGQTWQAVTVTDKGAGAYGVRFTVPAVAKTNGFGALRITATDGVGGTFDQTIQHAFAVSAA